MIIRHFHWLIIYQELALRNITRSRYTDILSIHPQTCDRHLVLGQGAGLIGTDYGGRTQRLNGSKPADEGVASDHLTHPQRVDQAGPWNGGMVTTAGNPSGTAAIAKLTAMMNTSVISRVYVWK